MCVCDREQVCLGAVWGGALVVERSWVAVLRVVVCLLVDKSGRKAHRSFLARRRDDSLSCLTNGERDGLRGGQRGLFRGTRAREQAGAHSRIATQLSAARAVRWHKVT